jgi:dihydrofolate synthase/folylpolyglutamate synthase
LDAVNVVEPDITIITSIDFDHMDYLGDTIEAIAREKAGIIRANKPVICGDQHIPQTIIDIAEQKQAPLHQLNHDFNYQITQETWQWQYSEKTFKNLPKPRCLLDNAATALMALHCLPRELHPSEAAIQQGLQSLQLTARQQWIHGKPTHLIDVAHNPQATKKLAEQLPRDKRIFAVVAMLKDKAHETTLAPLVDYVDQWFLAGLPESPRGGSAEQLQQALLSLQCPHYQMFTTVKTAYQQALKQANDDDLIVVFGSFYTVAEVVFFTTLRA